MSLLLKLLIVGLSLALYHGIDWEAGQYIFGIALMATVGIPHGATDHLLYTYEKEGEAKPKLAAAFMARYMGLMLLYALVWWLLPLPALLFFLLMSAYHFGETQWMEALPEAPVWIRRLLYLCWGGSLLGLLFYQYPQQTTFHLSYFVETSILEYYLGQLHWFIGAASLIWLLLALRYAAFQDVGKQLLDAGILLLLLLGTDLLLAFLLFFGFWHSMDAIGHQLKGLARVKPDIHWRDFVRYALPLSAISLLGIGLLLGAWYYWGDALSLVTLFFIAVSVLTLPHVWVMDRFYEGLTGRGQAAK